MELFGPDELVLRRDSTNEHVPELQEWLTQRDFLFSEIDGTSTATDIFDENTERAVKAFQVTARVAPDGVVGPTTRGKAKEFRGDALSHGWHPEAKRWVLHNQAPGEYTTSTRRGLLHVTVTWVLPRYVNRAGVEGGTSPHFTIGRNDRQQQRSGTTVADWKEVELWQHFPITVYSRALANPNPKPAEAETNKHGVIQLEIIWTPTARYDPPRIMVPTDELHTRDPELFAAVREWMRWTERHAGIRPCAYYPLLDEDDAAGMNGASRLTEAEWVESRGWVGHQHVPRNTHWDPGQVDLPGLIPRRTAVEVRSSSGQRAPATFDNNRVEPLVDGHAYFGAIRSAVEDVADGPDPYCYIASSWLGLTQGPQAEAAASVWKDDDYSWLAPFVLYDGSDEARPDFIDELETWSQRGIDVRVLPWVSTLAASPPIPITPQPWTPNIHSLLSVQALRTRHGMAHNVVLNTLSHSLGSMHLKLIVCGNDDRMVAFVGGPDFVANQVSGRQHPSGPALQDASWHDVGAKLEGPAASAVYKLFQGLWNEQLGRTARVFRVSGDLVPGHTDETREVPDRAATAGVGGNLTVAVARTLPAMRMNAFAGQPPLAYRNWVLARFNPIPLNLAPDGLFEIAEALREAIEMAERYVYIEDHVVWGRPLMEWLNARLKNQSDLKIILVFGGGGANIRPTRYLDSAVALLVDGIDDAAERVVFYRRTDNVVMHSGVGIIDDRWAQIGSASCSRRALYTNGEASLIVQEPEVGGFASMLRAQLWSEHCGQPDSDILENLDEAMGIWQASWAVEASPANLTNRFERMNVPFVYADPSVARPIGRWRGPKPLFDYSSEYDANAYDIEDPDSRIEY